MTSTSSPKTLDTSVNSTVVSVSHDDSIAKKPTEKDALRCHLEGAYQASSVRAYCQINGSIKRGRLQNLFKKSGLTEMKAQKKPFDDSIKKIVDDFVNATFDVKPATAAPSDTPDDDEFDDAINERTLGDHLCHAYEAVSLRRYVKQTKNAIPIATLSRHFRSSGLREAKKQGKPLDASMKKLIYEYCAKLDARKKSRGKVNSVLTENHEKYVEALSKTDKGISKDTIHRKIVKLETDTVRSILASTPAGGGIRVQKDGETSFVVATRDARDKDKWWVPHTEGGVLELNSEELMDASKWTVQPPEVVSKDRKRTSQQSRRERRRQAAVMLEMAKTAAKQQHREMISTSLDAVENIHESTSTTEDFMQAFKEKFMQEILPKIEAPFETTVPITYQERTEDFNVTVCGSDVAAMDVLTQNTVAQALDRKKRATDDRTGRATEKRRKMSTIASPKRGYNAFM